MGAQNSTTVEFHSSLARKFPAHIPTLNVPCTVTNNFHLHDVTEDDIRQVINKLPGNKAAGHDAISSRILKENIDVLCSPLCHIFNHAFSSKTYPSILKTAKVIPVYKSGDRNPSGQLQTNICPE